MANKEGKEDMTTLRKKVRRLEDDLGYSNLTVNATPHSSYQRIHQSWHADDADDDDDQILIKYRKEHLPGILPLGGFKGPTPSRESRESREANISSSGILPAEPLQLEWKPVPWTRSTDPPTHPPHQHLDVSSGSLLANNNYDYNNYDYNNYDSSIGESKTLINIEQEQHLGSGLV